MKHRDKPIADSAAARLLSLIERIERLVEERRALGNDIADIKREAKAAGFDVRTINRMLAERQLTSEQLEEQEALADIYRHALGALDGTPLGDAARKRLSRPPQPPPSDDATGEAAPEEPAPEPEPPPAPITPELIVAARAEGAAAAAAQLPVLGNPYPAGDPRRAAWDEGWCHAAGSDGMDVPPEWRRSKPAKDPKPKSAKRKK